MIHPRYCCGDTTTAGSQRSLQADVQWLRLFVGHLSFPDVWNWSVPPLLKNAGPTLRVPRVCEYGAHARTTTGAHGALRVVPLPTDLSLTPCRWSSALLHRY